MGKGFKKFATTESEMSLMQSLGNTQEDCYIYAGVGGARSSHVNYLVGISVSVVPMGPGLLTL